MHLRVLQRRRHAVRANKMFFRNKEPGARAGFPLPRVVELLRGAIKLDGDRRLRGRFRRNCRRSDKAIVKLNGAPPNRDGRNEKQNRRSHQHRAIVIRLKPVNCFCHDQTKEPRITRISQIGRIRHEDQLARVPPSLAYAIRVSIPSVHS